MKYLHLFHKNRQIEIFIHHILYLICSIDSNNQYKTYKNPPKLSKISNNNYDSSAISEKNVIQMTHFDWSTFQPQFQDF